MIDIIDLRKYFENDNVLISDHAAMRFRQRGLKVKDIRCAVNNGEIVEQYPEDFRSQVVLFWERQQMKK